MPGGPVSGSAEPDESARTVIHMQAATRLMFDAYTFRSLESALSGTPWDSRANGLLATVRTAIATGALIASLPVDASNRCVECHPDEVAGYLNTGMGRSLARPDSAQPTGTYHHGPSDTRFEIEFSDRGMVHRIRRGGLEASYGIDYVVGSGNAARGYLVRVGNAVFQSPVTYYTAEGRWGMAPGMEGLTDPDFTRPVTAECLWCHAGKPRPVAGSVNRYRSPVFEAEAISCDRCHGPSDAHLDSPAATTIFNPAKAPPRQRDSVCEQCHLAGLARVLNPGQTFGSFEPGRPLEDFWAVFVGAPDRPDARGRFQVVSHVEQLALSRCAQRSGESLWCGSCHDPHSAPERPKRFISGKCVECHKGKMDAEHASLADDCVTCHMPQRQSHDSGHSAFTDHRIMRRPAAHPPSERPRRLQAWAPQDGPLGKRNLGIATIRLARSEAFAGDVYEGLTVLAEVTSEFEEDPALLEAMGTGLVLAGSPRGGLLELQRAVQAAPDRALYRHSLAAAWWELDNAKEAIDEINRAIDREPLLESGYHMLARVHLASGNRTGARVAWTSLLGQRRRLILPRQQVRHAGETGRFP